MKMTFTAAGDMLVQRRIHRESDGFADVSGFLRKADVRYINLETTLHRGEFYAKQGMTSDATMRELFYDRSAGYTRGLMRDRRMLESVIPYFEMEGGKLTKLELMPIELHFDDPVWRSGNPRFSNQHGIVERLAEMSAPCGTKIVVDDRGYGIVEVL